MRIPTCILIALFGISGLCRAQEHPPGGLATPDRIQEFNRSGEWRAAAAGASALLQEGAPPLAPMDQGRVRLSLAYAHLRLGEPEQAREALRGFEALGLELADDHWLHRQARRLAAELDPAAPPGEPAPADGSNADGFWEQASPAELGLDSDLVEEHRRLAEETGADACLLVRHGKIASEWYGPRYAPPVNAMSSTKSITGLLAGMLLEEGRIERLEEPVGTYLPEWSEGPRSAVTLRHLLTHTSGLPRLRGQGVGFESDKNTFVRSLQLATAPGTAFAYSNEGVQLLSPILDRAAGEPIQDYARRRLFEPLGMLDTRLRLDQEGHAWTYADMITTPRDLARIGLLMLQRGRWQGKPIVSAEWIEKSTRPSQELEPRCGLLWWVHTEPRGFAALGYLHTDIHVFPSRDLVVVRTQARPAPDGSQPDYRRQALPLLARMVQEE